MNLPRLFFLLAAIHFLLLTGCSSNNHTVVVDSAVPDRDSARRPDDANTAPPDIARDVEPTQDLVVMPDLPDIPQPLDCPPFSDPTTQQLKLHQSPTQQGDWTIALREPHAFTPLTITALSSPRQTIAAFDYQATEVAGFVATRETSAANAEEALAGVLETVHLAMPNESRVRTSGIRTKSHDGFDMLRGTTIDLDISTSNASAVRNEIAVALADTTMPSVPSLPGPLGASTSSFVLRMAILLRDVDPTSRQLVVIGAVAPKDSYQNPTLQTGFVVDDLSNGTTIARAGAQLVAECHKQSFDKLPAADIIWVVDESGSMDDNRYDLVANASDFYAYALASGLDFRMGVTGVCDPADATMSYAVGKFCSKVSADSADEGGVDRFLNITDQAIFSSCLKNPPGLEQSKEYGLINAIKAIERHLPRAPNQIDRIRSEAHLAVIIATDERSAALSDAVAGPLDECTTAPLTAGQIESFVSTYVSQLNAEAAAVYLLGGVCNNGCDADVGHAYHRVALRTGGQIADVCQKDIGYSLHAFLSAIVSATSPKLQHVPVSASLELAVDGSVLARSRTQGFDYGGSHNAVIFQNVPFQKGSPLVTRYYRFK